MAILTHQAGHADPVTEGSNSIGQSQRKNYNALTSLAKSVPSSVLCGSFATRVRI